MCSSDLFAGPNGSGKSSIIARVQFGGRSNLLEADAIAARIHASDPRLAAIAADREVLRRTRAYLETRDDFAIETTLSGVWAVKAISRQGREAILCVWFISAWTALSDASNAFASELLRAVIVLRTTTCGAATSEVCLMFNTCLTPSLKPYFTTTRGRSRG